jgi:hypothetical protein
VSCHTSFHQTYGIQNNTLTQVIEFFSLMAKEVSETDAMDSFISRLGRYETCTSTAC